MIKTLIKKYGGKNYPIPDLWFLLIWLLGFAGFLCTEKLLEVMLKNLILQGSNLEISIQKLKTDQHREGHVIYISRIKSQNVVQLNI